MGNSASDSSLETGREIGSRVLLFLHRTWTVIVTEKWRTRVTRRNCDSVSDYDSRCSQYSFCSCSQCQRDDGFSSGCDRWVAGLCHKLGADLCHKLGVVRIFFPSACVPQ
ncbi:hypothetical protein MTP99_018118 [Tenebrio molitor]|nr:hypothetical protein MTP99_018118 [Tenebrio molitor]